MGFPFFSRRRAVPTFTALYGAIVTQARSPIFYTGFGVPDTLGGRFDMIVLHLALVIRRLRGEPDLRDASQGVFDAFCADMDANLRELGVSDVGLPKRMRAFGEAFYGRAAAYDEAFATPDPGALAAALRRNVYPDVPAGETAAEPLAAFVRAADAALSEQDGRDIADGRIAFPDAAAFAPDRR